MAKFECTGNDAEMYNLVFLLVAAAFYFACWWNIIRAEPKIKSANYFLISSLCDLALIAGCIVVLQRADEFKLSDLIRYFIYGLIAYELYLSIKSLVSFFKLCVINKKGGKQHENSNN